ncbi:MAG: hypothetical protein ACI83D_000120 [Planctomycetota bacterium]|jgi:hypothetical protein
MKKTLVLILLTINSSHLEKQGNPPDTTESDMQISTQPESLSVNNQDQPITNCRCPAHPTLAYAAITERDIGSAVTETACHLHYLGADIPPTSDSFDARFIHSLRIFYDSQDMDLHDSTYANASDRMRIKALYEQACTRGAPRNKILFSKFHTKEAPRRRNFSSSYMRKKYPESVITIQVTEQ